MSNLKLLELEIVEKNEIIEDITKPYFNSKTFFFDGRDIKKDDIKSLKIYQTDKLSKILADFENNKDKEFVGFHWSKEDVVTYEEEYSKNITSEIMKDIKKQLNASIKIDQIKQNLDLSKVFIVHGHDDALKLEVSRFLEKLNITPIILHEQANEGKTIDVFNNGDMLRDFTYIDDIVEGITRVIDNPAQKDKAWNGKTGRVSTSSAPYKVYNIGNNNPVKLMDFITAIENKLGKTIDKNFMPIQAGDVPATFADVTDLIEDLDYKPETPIQDGINNFIDWYLDFFGYDKKGNKIDEK